MGGRSYEAFSEVWPTIDFRRLERDAEVRRVDHRHRPAVEQHHGALLLDDVAGLKETEGGPIYVQGSMLLTQNLLKAGLVDEMRLMVFPVILGSGRGSFPDDAEEKVKLTLAESTAYANGVHTRCSAGGGGGRVDQR